MRIDKRFSLQNCLKRSKSTNTQDYDINKIQDNKQTISYSHKKDTFIESSSSLLGFDELFDEDYERIMKNE